MLNPKRESVCCHLSVLLVVAVAIVAGAGSAWAVDPRMHSGSEVGATWEGGEATIAELEAGIPATQTPACQGSSLGAWSENPDGVASCLEDVARRIALEDVVLREIPDLRGAVARQGEPPGALLRRAYANTWRRLYAEETAGQITDTDIMVYYETHRDRFRQRGSVELWNIFRRYDQDRRPEDTEAELLELTARIEAGASFEEMAREHSQSETRARGGLVGDVTRGQLPPELEAVVFELEVGEISRPIPVAGGAVILQVRRVTEGGDLPLDLVKDRVAGQIAAERRTAAVADLVKSVDIPPGSTVMSRSSLSAALDGTDLEAPVLVVYDTIVTVGQLRERERIAAGVRVSELSAGRQEALWSSYLAMTNGALLGAALVESADPKLRSVAESVALEQGARAIVIEVLEAGIQPSRIEASVLRQYFDENRDRYRIPLRLKLRLCEAPFGDDPIRRFARMDEADKGLSADAVKLEETCSSVEGRLAALDWASPQELSSRLHPKALSLVRALDVGETTVPFQQSRSFVIVELVDRRSPREMSFEEARDQIAREVAEIKHRQSLRTAADERLSAAGFRFDRERVRASLGSSSTPRSSS